MKSVKLACLVMIGVSVFQSNLQLIQANPLAKFIGEFLLGKTLDSIWDKATGKPDIRELERRIKELEGIVAQTNPNLSPPIRELRNSITPDTSKEDFRRMVEKVDSKVSALERRADITDRDMKELKRRMAKLEDKALYNKYEGDVVPTPSSTTKPQQRQLPVQQPGGIPPPPQQPLQQTVYQPPVQPPALSPSTSPPSVTSSAPSFNGAWFSSQYNFGFRIEGKIGRATKSNSPKFAPGDIILHIESVSENQFQGHQMYTDGNWYKVSGELLDAQTLKMRDNSSMHTMARQAEREQPKISPAISRQASPPVASAMQLVNVSISIWEKTPGRTGMSAQVLVDGQRIGIIDNRERPMTLHIGQLTEGTHTLYLIDIKGYRIDASLNVVEMWARELDCSNQFIVSAQKPSLSLFTWYDGQVTTCGVN